MKKALLAIVAVVVVAAVALGSWAAFADDGDGPTARDTCDGRTTELSVEKDDGALEVSFELQSSAPGETWQIKIAQADEVLLEDERETDADAEIDVDVPARGDNRFTATATQRRRRLLGRHTLPR